MEETHISYNHRLLFESKKKTLNKMTPSPQKKSAGAKKGSKRGPKLDKNGKRIKKHNFKSYSGFVYKLMTKNFGVTAATKSGRKSSVAITSRGMGIVNSFVVDLFERIAEEAGHASHFAGQKTLTPQAIMAGVRMNFPEEMASHAWCAGLAAVAKYTKALKKKGSPRK